ncbi:MAG: hypothetical protein ABR567_03585 [Myxococcales bacterium]|nr:hypothetical protein [Myxococcales bacterium]
MRKLFMLVLCACAAPLPTPDQPGARDAYRATLDVDAKGPRAREAREKLEEAEWDAARAAHTIFAYRRFLKEFEDSRHGPEARQLLEGLRWAQADKDGSETALAAYVADEPRGSHAQEAWSRLSSLRLASALTSGSAISLRSWLAENPAAAGREKAEKALDEADWHAAADTAAWRTYLGDHLDGAHRKEAQARLDKALRDEAELLEDEAALRTLGDPAADRIAFEKAAALLDEGKLAQLARRPGPFAADAARDLSLLRKDPRRAALLEAAAHKLFLPRATLDELPEDAPRRAARLREWAASLDGARLHRLLMEIASPRAQVSLAALDGAEALLKGLPAAEARVRAEREVVSLEPLAVDAPQLTALAVVQVGLGRSDAALASVRSASSRNPRCAPAVSLAARLETEKALQQIALQIALAAGRDLAAAHAAAARAGDASAIGELCAALRLSPDELSIRRQIEESRGACAEKPLDFAQDRTEAARFLAAARTPLARPALARAAARDPDSSVRAAARGAVALDLAR